MALGPVGLVALLGTSRPIRPLGHVAVFGDHAGLEGHRHFLLGAQTADQSKQGGARGYWIPVQKQVQSNSGVGMSQSNHLDQMGTLI